MKSYSIPVLFMLLVFFANCFSATPADEKQIIIKKKHSKITLGVVITQPDSEDLKKYNLDGGALIMKVITDSEADRIGLKKGDIITRFAGQSVKSPDDLRELIEEMEEPAKVEITVMRDGQKKTFTADLKPGGPGEIEEDFDIEVFPEGKAPGIFAFRHCLPAHTDKGGFLGVRAEDLSDQLREYFEVKHGVLIKKVIEDSPAEKAGLKAGDVITEINGRAVKDYDDLVRILNYYNPGEKVKVDYSRKGKKSSVEVVLGEKKKFHGMEKARKSIKMFLDEFEHPFDFEIEKELEEKFEKMKEKFGEVKVKILVI
ncbi:MAG: hypothetical protein Kow0042_18240 [Calditrichia bacterium]